MTAFKATYSDFKLIKTRQCVQIIFEVPLSDYPAAAEVLGGMPDPAKERWFGIAPLRSDVGAERVQNEPAKVKKDWRDMKPSQQAALRCNSLPFQAFLKEQHGNTWAESDANPAECVRRICCVSSRGFLDTVNRARVIWKQLDDQFQAWSRVGA